MKLLLDANLSWRLSKAINKVGFECVHVDNISLKAPAKDIDIWNFAFKNGYIIISNDEDFVDLVNFKGFPPKVVILKTGNQSSKYLETLLISCGSKLEEFSIQSEYGVLEFF
jgi:predicted nuclease of predicted toxin-antitoxin system